MAKAKVKKWTCARCEVTVGFPVGPDTPKLPVARTNMAATTRQPG